MAEYIERDTAIRAVMAAKWVDGSDGAMAMEIVASPPAADVAPVVRGHWIEQDGMQICSNCGADIHGMISVLRIVIAVARKWRCNTCGLCVHGAEK